MIFLHTIYAFILTLGGGSAALMQLLKKTNATVDAQRPLVKQVIVGLIALILVVLVKATMGVGFGALALVLVILVAFGLHSLFKSVAAPGALTSAAPGGTSNNAGRGPTQAT